MLDFIYTLNNQGFAVQEGSITYIDILNLCSEGKVDSALGNNVGAPYAICLLPPALDQEPSQGQQPPIGYNPNNPNNYPANLDYIAPGFSSKMRPDEAIVIIGRTPPPALYYSFRSYLGFVPDQPDKDYSEYITAGNEFTGLYHMLFASLGDQLNNYNLWTVNTPKGIPGFPYNSSTIIISTADKGMNNQIRNALSTAGYNPDIMNDDNIPLELVNMGLERGKDSFIYMMRIALWANQSIGSWYLNNINNFFKIFRVTPIIPLTDCNPWPVPTLKFRETGVTEYQVVPNCRNDLDNLRNEIFNKYRGIEFDAIAWTLQLEFRIITMLYYGILMYMETIEMRSILKQKISG